MGFRDFCKPDSNTLTSVLTNNQLARGMLSKSIQGLGAEPLVGGEAPHKPRCLWGQSPLTQYLFSTFVSKHFFAPILSTFFK